MSPKKFDPFRRFEETPSRLYVIFALLAFAAHIVICVATDASPALVGIILIGAYLISALTVLLISRRRLDLLRIESDACEEQNNGVVYAFSHSAKGWETSGRNRHAGDLLRQKANRARADDARSYLPAKNACGDGARGGGVRRDGGFRARAIL